MAIDFDQVGFTYQPNTPFATPGLHDVSFEIPDGKFTAVIGHTGSGKSTMVQHLDGLVLPTTGKITMGNQVVTAETKLKELNELRAHIGLVFQFPEAQLFEQTVIKDVMFGPKNFGASDKVAQAAAKVALEKVGISADLYERSPFELSGGQMRRVAIAGVIAMEPDLLILDEPTAGLDPQGQRELMTLFTDLQKERQITVVLITHQMEYVAQYADHVVVFEHGTVVKSGSPATIFADENWLHEKQLDVPAAKQFADALAEKGVQLHDVLDINQLADQLAARLNGEVDHV
ncbi:energy-coupling factor transporter ATPase [Weissella paramesenteroides]|jgi:energy-coupling factor transport system ATP-binding protein|uniref:energy-coupling factor transporter ATPase n=1 Tax=Weissella paramesenteroides TaxID=1249 RepID=UPI00123BD825|nr:energy-coupling factor transporter ATPase [Weissella paramesenteroides]KAA8456949.1 energy-coupling factor transporter ATPase [Weissella paramesenteroides]KAA8458482.1 energy-coupling factor transporter ATPase [Weissella paramesenteroides]KAA8460389.1 energy-coupling factor transporter ATPase [Weissella paramesenteroides]KAA8462784.1 energy-coupling factor transporter ATPase [Weissella paramesenteroides]KAA8464095.1 energy-coupling factor transporter ATPase [Weissella paramesenteroides]